MSLNKMSVWNTHHLAKHKNKKFTCNTCKRIFVTPGSYKNHISLHKEMWYSCNHCDRRFVYPYGLNIHKSLHSRHRMHACFSSGCKKCYKWRHDLLRHVNNHIQSVQYSCKLCNYSTYEGRLYCRHLIVHTTKKLIKCRHCPLRFKYALQRWRHDKTCIND